MRVETRIRSPLARDNALAPVATREKFTGLFAECVAPPRGGQVSELPYVIPNECEESRALRFLVASLLEMT